MIEPDAFYELNEALMLTKLDNDGRKMIYDKLTSPPNIKCYTLNGTKFASGKIIIEAILELCREK